MRALSVRQPWAWCILHADKRIENRSLEFKYRGPILLHASKACTGLDYDSAEEGLYRHGLVGDLRETEDGQPLPELWIPDLAELPRGGIVGRAQIIDCLRPGHQTDYHRARAHGVDLRWWVHEEAFGLVLANVVSLPFVPWKGALGLFDVPDDYATRGAPQPATPHPELFPGRA